jgi:amidase
MIREGNATSTEIVKDHIERIKLFNGNLNALVSLFEEEALEVARLCDHEAAGGAFRGPLHGVPVTIKEQFWIRGKKSNMNFKMLKDFVAPADAVIVERIRNSGAVILGQTNVPKNLIDYQVNGDIYPEGKNPFDTSCTPGGSTGGGAAALAAGFTSLELGADFAGSVRVPAAYCGLFALKPTENTVPLHGNIPLPKNSKTFLMHMNQAGPLARSLDDVELLWNIIKGPHESDRNIPDINWAKPTSRNLADYKIAWTDGWPGFGVSNTVSNAISDLIEKIKSTGCKAENQIPGNNLHFESLKVYGGLFPYIVSQGTPSFIRTLIKWQLNRGLLNGMPAEMDEIKKEMSRAFKFRANHYAEVLLKRSIVTMHWENFFNDYEFLICPISYGPAHKLCKTGGKISYGNKEIVYINYAWPYSACFNASGHPSVAIPLGLSREGLPLGIQIVGKYWSEPELLSFAKKITALTPGFVKPHGY